MSSARWHRVLYPGLLLFGLSLALSKSASNILLALLALTAATGALCSGEFRGDLARSWRQPLTAALTLFCLVAYAGILHTENAADGFGVANKFVTLPAVYVLVSVLAQAGGRVREASRTGEHLLASFLGGVAALDALGVLTFLGVIGDNAFTLPLTGLDLHHIWFSNLNAIGLYAAGALLLFGRLGASARAKVYLSGFLLLSLACVLLSTSRTAWFSLMLTAAALILFLIRRGRIKLLVLAAAVLVFALAYRFVPVVQERIDRIPQELALFFVSDKKPSSIGSRLLMWKGSLLMFRSHPLVGVGTGDYVRSMEELRALRLVPRHLLDYNQPHNMYFFALATNGLAGLAALLFIFLRALRSAAAALRPDGHGRLFATLALATAIHFMIAGFMDSLFNIQMLRYCFAFVMGVCLRGGAAGGGPGAPARCPAP